MSLVPTDTSRTRVNVQNNDQLSINSVTTKIIVVGATESGRTARALDIKSAKSLAMTTTKTPQLRIVRTMTSQSTVNDALRRQTVIKLLLYLNMCWKISHFLNQVHAKAFNITNERATTANTKSTFEGVKSKFIVTI